MKSFHRPGHKVATALAVSGLAALALGSVTAAAKGTAAAAHVGAPVAGKANAPTGPLAVTTPAKYRIVSSAVLTNPAGTESAGSVTCPVVSGVQTKPTGGGVFITSGDLGANVNSSIPSGNSWEAWVNNNTSSDTSFTVYAICAKPKLSYNIQTAGITVPAGTETSGAAICPTGQKVVGGGVFVSSSDLAANVNQGNPNGNREWLAYVNNGGSLSTSASVYAICEKYSPSTAGYTIVASTSTGAGAGTQDFAQASCPVVNGIQTSVLGGGESNSSTSLAFNINSIWPNSSTSYGTWVNNGDSNAATFNSWAICAYK